VLACGPESRYGHLGLPLALDARPGGGPLAGLEAGLACARSEWVAALACDMPRADPRVFLALLDHAEEGHLDACLLETRTGVEPLCAVYHRSCLAPIRAALAAGERKLTAFHRFAKSPASSGELLSVGTLAESALPGELAALGVAVNLNTPEDLRAETGAPVVVEPLAVERVGRSAP
jgi:molybdopterin-guanine dinucleotide biosynthesis protein A